MSCDMNMKEFKPNIEEVISRYMAYCQFEEADRPLLHIQVPIKVKYPGYGATVSKKREIEQFERYFQVRSAVLDDWIPVIWASWSGLGRLFIEGRKPPEPWKLSGTLWERPLLQDWTEVDKLEADFESKKAKGVLERIDKVVEDSRGRYAVSAGFFCPGDAVARLVGHGRNFIVGIFKHLDEFKALMKLCSETQLKATKLLLERINHPFDGTVNGQLQNWMPGKESAGCQEDCAVYFSAQMYSEFLKPYDEWGMSKLDFTTFHNDNAWQITPILQDMTCLGVLQLTDSGSANTGFKGTRAIGLETLRKRNRKKPIIISCMSLEEIEYVMRNLGVRGLLICTRARSIKEANKLINKVEDLANSKLAS